MLGKVEPLVLKHFEFFNKLVVAPVESVEYAKHNPSRCGQAISLSKTAVGWP